MIYRKWLLISTLGLAGLVLAQAADAGGNNVEHELVVYSLKTYGTYAGQNWKSTINTAYSSMDPYQDFWSNIYNCSGTECAHAYSARYENSAVTVNQMATEYSTQTDRGWDGSDFVVFYGHNTMIKPQWSDTFDLWRYNSEFFTWYHYNLADWTAWGTATEKYQYHQSWVSDASLTNAFAVFYGSNPFTSILIGKDFPKTGNWNTENTWNQSTADTRDNHFGGEVEWIIANGCNAVTVANPEGTSALSLGVNAWSKSWDGLHMVLGHYYSTDVGSLPNLGAYATDLKSGGLVQPAYFDRHTCPNYYDEPAGYCQPAAIEIQPAYFCYPAPCPTHYMDADKWNPNEMADVTQNYRYKTRWNVGL